MNLMQKIDSILNASEDEFLRIKKEILSCVTQEAAQKLIATAMNAEKNYKIRLLRVVLEIRNLPIQNYLVEAFSKEKDPDAKLLLTVSLGRNGNRKIIASLIELINSDNFIMKHKAVLALQLIGNQALNELLIIMFKNVEKNYSFAEMIARIIIQIPDKTLNDVEKILNVKSPLVAKILGSITDPQIVPILIGFLDQRNHVLSRSVREAFEEMGPRYADQLAEYLNHNNDEYNYWVTRILHSYGSYGKQLLMQKIKGATPGLMRNILEVVDYNGEEELKELYLNLLFKGTGRTKELAARKIISCGDETFPIEIKRLYFEKLPKLEPNTRFFMLYIMNETGIANDIIQEMFRSNDSEKLLAAIIKTMHPIKDDFNLLVELLKESDPFIRQAGYNSLTLIAKECFPQIMEFSMIDHPEIKKNCLSLISRMSKEGVNLVREMLVKGNPTERFQAAFIAGQLYMFDLKEELEKLRKDGNDWVRKYVMQALARMGGPEEAVKLLVSSDPGNFSTALELLREDIETYASTFLESWQGIAEDRQQKIKKIIFEADSRSPGIVKTIAAKAGGQSKAVLDSMLKQLELDQSFQL